MTQFGNTAVIVSMGVMKNEEDLVQAGCRTVDGKFFRGIVTEAEKRRTEIWLSREGSRLGRCSRKREQPWVKCQGQKKSFEESAISVLCYTSRFECDAMRAEVQSDVAHREAGKTRLIIINTIIQ